MFEIILFKNGVEVQVVPLVEPISTLGRADNNQFVLAEDSVSRRHARLLLENGRLFVEDLRSGNGTFMKNRRIESRIELKDGDEFSITPFTMRVRSQLPGAQVMNMQQSPDARTVMIPSMPQQSAPLDPARTGARLILRRGDSAKSSYVMGTGPLTIGRSEDRDIILTDPASSRRHAVINWMGDHFYVRDEGSANGIVINGQGTREGALKPGDRVVIGETEFEFVWPGAPQPATPYGYGAPPGMPQNFQGGFAGQMPGMPPMPPGMGQAPHQPGIDPYSETGIMPAYPQWPGQPGMPGMPGMPMDPMQQQAAMGYNPGVQGMTELGMPSAPKKSPLRLVAVMVVVLLFAAIGIKVISDKTKPVEVAVSQVQADPCEGVGETCADPADQVCMNCLTKRARLTRGLELFRQGEYDAASQEFARVLTDLDPLDIKAARYRYISYEFWVLGGMEETLRDRSQTATQKLQKIKDDFAKGKELYARVGKTTFTKDTPENVLATARTQLSEVVSVLNNVTKIHSDEPEAKAIQKEADTLRRNSLAQINRLRSIKEASAQEAFVSGIQQAYEDAVAQKNAGNIGKASAKFKEVIDKDRARKTEYPALAQQELESLNRAAKDRAKPLVAEASARMKNEQWPEAKAKLNEALRIDPNLEEAKEKLRIVDAECMSQAKKLFNEAKVQYNVQQNAQAEKLLRKVIALVPDKDEDINQKSMKMLRDMGKE